MYLMSHHAALASHSCGIYGGQLKMSLDFHILTTFHLKESKSYSVSVLNPRKLTYQGQDSTEKGKDFVKISPQVGSSDKHSICFSESSKENQAQVHHSSYSNTRHIAFTSFPYSSSPHTPASRHNHLNSLPKHKHLSEP